MKFESLMQIYNLPYFLGATPRTGQLDVPWLEPRWSESANQCYNQTTGGIFLEIYYGIPGSLWTPYGKWGCWGGGSGQHTYLDVMLDLLGAEMYGPEVINEQGHHGPVYKVTRLPVYKAWIYDNDGLVIPGHSPLPDAILRDRDDYPEYGVQGRAWASMIPDYYLPLMTEFNRDSVLRRREKVQGETS
jgi:hypothetical protein